MIVKNRIKQIRKNAKLTQVEFGEKIGVKGNTITGYETGLRNPTDAVILSICREFNVNEEWLRNGTGKMFKPIFENDYIADMISEVIMSDEENFKRKLISALSRLDDDGWKNLENLVNMILEKK